MEEGKPPGKKLKVELVEKEVKGSGSRDNQLQNQQPSVDTAKSPITVPMLMPEMWAQVFEFLSPDELQTVMNTTPEWNQLLHFQKPKILFPKVLACMGDYLSMEESLPFRVISKTCETGVERAYPIIRFIINFSEAMRHEARGLALQDFRYENEGEEEVEGEFVEEVQAFRALLFNLPPQ